MKKRSFWNLIIIVLAYMHRYGCLVFVALGVKLFGKDKTDVCLVLGVIFLFYAVYSLVGYICRWKHIYCSYQNAYHIRMTPEIIEWQTIRKKDAYGVPVLLGLMGIGLIILCFF